MKYRILPPEVWIEIRRMYEQGRPAWLLCREFGIGKSTLMARRSQEGWSRKSLAPRLMGGSGMVATEQPTPYPPGTAGADVLPSVADTAAQESAPEPHPARTPLPLPQDDAGPPVDPRAMREVTSSHLRLAATIRRRITALLAEDELGAGAGSRRSRAALDAATALEKLQRVERVALGMNERESPATTKVVIMVPPKLTPEAWLQKAQLQAQEIPCDVEEADRPRAPGVAAWKD